MKRKKTYKSFISVLILLSNAAPSLAETRTIEYGYDELGRIKTVDTDGERLTRNAYDYDNADNRTKKASTVSLPLASVSIGDKSVNVSSRNLLDGTARYKLRSDGSIEVTQTVVFNYGGSSTPYYYNQTVVIGRWFAAGYSATNFSLNATLANSHGNSPCSEGNFGKNLPAHYDLSWAMAYPASGSPRKTCRIYIEILDAANPYFVLGSAYITISSGVEN